MVEAPKVYCPKENRDVPIWWCTGSFWRLRGLPEYSISMSIWPVWTSMPPCSRLFCIITVASSASSLPLGATTDPLDALADLYPNRLGVAWLTIKNGGHIFFHPPRTVL